MSAYFSVDFEDFSHDLGRKLNVEKQVGPRIDALHKAYSEIDKLIKCYSNDSTKGGTFFITGILAEQAPDLVHQISNDGHEVACHYHYHDEMRKQTPKEVEYYLQRAIDSLESAANIKVDGFRAPYFKIDKERSEQYQLVEKYFKYDSSLCVNSQQHVDAFYKKMGLKSLKLLPVFSAKIYMIPMRLGGTFARIFPAFCLEKLFEQNRLSDLQEIFYFHPYEFQNGKDWKLSFGDLSHLSTRQKIYWHFRQNQWLGFGNQKLSKKIQNVMKDIEFNGHMRDLV